VAVLVPENARMLLLKHFFLENPNIASQEASSKKRQLGLMNPPFCRSVTSTFEEWALATFVE